MAMEITDKHLKLTKTRIEALTSLGIANVEELLSYYPMRYETMNVKPFEEWQMKEQVAFEGRVVSAVKSWRHGRLTTSSFEVESDDHILKITIFNRPWAKNLKLNDVITVTGNYMGGNKVTAMSYDMKSLKEHAGVTPVYSTKAGIKQKTIHDSIAKVYEYVQNEIRDIVPEEFIAKYRLLRKSEALRRIHFPETLQDVKSAVRTLKYEEFLRFFTAMQCLKNEEVSSGYKMPKKIDYDLVQKCVSDLPYELTPDQKSTLKDILNDMSSNKAMYRLVQGDVGCGKTAVSALAMIACASAGYQAALLAPTEILARQHYQTMLSMFRNTNVKIGLLYSGLSNKEKDSVLNGCADGTLQIIIGTHSIIQEDVTFDNLGLVVADEQQRFGVEQRRALKNKGLQPDFLLMSATPIPRTLASTLFGDMDVSTIETMPAGRKTPVTKYIPENSFRSVLDDVKALLASGHQLYIICAAVEENEAYDARNVYDTAAAMRQLFPEYKTGVLHGRMNSEEKERVMNEFAENVTQILVSTTVVEVGMNVVNATGMIVYDADRFGLSQLHQLRGRIQRGSERGQCWLLSGNHGDKVEDRLNVLVKTNDGFAISYEDLRIRGPGDILGTRQSGIPGFILGNVVEDTAMINEARKDAVKIVQDQENPDYAPILHSIQERILNGSGYGD